MRRMVLVLVATFASSACSPRAGTWQYVFDDDASAARATSIEATILEGGCSGTRVLFRDRFMPPTGAVAPAALSPGTYGFAGRARDASCHWFASGCVTVTLPTAGVTVSLAATAEELDPTCLDGGTPDAGRDDSGAMEAGAVDGGRDAEASDAARTDAGPRDSTACDDALAGAMFCSGLELSALGDWAGVTTVGGGIGEWTSATAYRGVGAFRASVAAASARGEIAYDFGSPISSGELHARFYVRFGTPVSFRLNALGLEPSASPGSGFVMQVRDTTTALMVTAGTTTEQVASTDIPRDRWVCVQLDATIAASGSVSLSFDGAQVAALSAIDTRVTGGYGRMRLGVSWSSSMNTSGEMWVDEVALGTTSLPCD